MPSADVASRTPTARWHARACPDTEAPTGEVAAREGHEAGADRRARMMPRPGDTLEAPPPPARTQRALRPCGRGGVA
ncbi:hypothetical protein FTX61_05115 [Nitriliruptoraceae bacterium ZYF776]|nr:hypothetical protein [Profundirhabdus halotolerans]